VQRRHLGDGSYALVASGLEDRGILTVFTERSGGTSAPPYHSLNLGFQTGDDPSRVRENRRRVERSLGTPPLVTVNQVHGAAVVRVGPEGTVGVDEAKQTDADALEVQRPGIPAAVLVADCLPIVLASSEKAVVVHAGWRGLAAGILNRAVSRFDTPALVAAAIGPAVGPCHYEVEEEVARAVESGSSAGAVGKRRGDRVALDLPATAERILEEAGVTVVEQAGLCTACEESRFFSHRRDGLTGRQAGIALRL
jgi:YfiH family protein